MKNVLKKIAIFAFSMTFTLLAALTPVSTVFASGTKSATPVGENTAWIRAKLTWQYDAGIKGLDNSLIEFSNDGWSKSGDWYYYNLPVNPGDKIRLINGVRIPYEWDNKTVDKKFKLIVTVEGSEVAPGDTGWDKNVEAVFSEDFTVWSQGYHTDEDVWVEEGGLKVRINEYQLDDDGNIVTYVNDKIVVPGQFVSKIVEIEVDGKKGSNVKLKPEDPIKRVYVDTVDVDGKVVDFRTALRYEITVKNPAPNKRTITVYDMVDPRLTVTDPCGATVRNTTKGTELTWSVEVEGKGEATIMFHAKAVEGLSEEETYAIPNKAEADIVGKRVKSNTVVIGLGPKSGPAAAELAIKMAVTRATGDYGIFGLLAFAAAILSVIMIIVMIIRRKSKRSEEEYENKKD